MRGSFCPQFMHACGRCLQTIPSVCCTERSNLLDAPPFLSSSCPLKSPLSPLTAANKALAALEMAYRVGENGIMAAYRETDVMEQLEDITTDQGAWKAWRLLQVSSALDKRIGESD